MDLQEVKFLVEAQRRSHEEIAWLLQHRYPGQRGFSARSVRRFCQENNISARSGLDDASLEGLVRRGRQVLGPGYGRRTMTGFVSSEIGKPVGEMRVRAALSRVAPEEQRQRGRATRRMMNPVPYTAMRFGQKLHLDQNEKLIRYGVTHVLAIDGYSRKVVGFVIMPIKNPIAIYDQLFAPLLRTDGIWDQVRTDRGREFDLMLAVQDSLEEHRVNREKAPHLRTQSIRNLRAERFWVYVNQRVNYPLKSALRDLEEREVFDLSDDIDKFCVSWVTIQVAWYGIRQLIDSWNCHRISVRRGRGLGGIPNVLAARTRHTGNPVAVPSTEAAIAAFETSGGRLTRPGICGNDPLGGQQNQIEVRQHLLEECYEMEALFSDVVNGSAALLSAAIQDVKWWSVQLCQILP